MPPPLWIKPKGITHRTRKSYTVQNYKNILMVLCGIYYFQFTKALVMKQTSPLTLIDINLSHNIAPQPVSLCRVFPKTMNKSEWFWKDTYFPFLCFTQRFQRQLDDLFYLQNVVTPPLTSQSIPSLSWYSPITPRIQLYILYSF